MSAPACCKSDGLPASSVLERLLETLPEERVSLGWLHRELNEHSLEMLAFIMSLIGVLPGASMFVGILMVLPALGMMFWPSLALPAMVARRSISTRQASLIIGYALPLVRSCEAATALPKLGASRLVRACVGLLLLLLSVTLLIPVPLSNVPPALVMAGLAIASFQRDIILLAFCAAAALGSLAFSCITLMAAAQAFAGVV